MRRRCKWPESPCTTVSAQYVAAEAFLINVSRAMPHLFFVSVGLFLQRTLERSSPIFSFFLESQCKSAELAGSKAAKCASVAPPSANEQRFNVLFKKRRRRR